MPLSNSLGQPFRRFFLQRQRLAVISGRRTGIRQHLQAPRIIRMPLAYRASHNAYSFFRVAHGIHIVASAFFQRGIISQRHGIIPAFLSRNRSNQIERLFLKLQRFIIHSYLRVGNRKIVQHRRIARYFLIPDQSPSLIYRHRLHPGLHSLIIITRTVIIRAKIAKRLSHPQLIIFSRQRPFDSKHFKLRRHSLPVIAGSIIIHGKIPRRRGIFITYAPGNRLDHRQSNAGHNLHSGRIVAALIFTVCFVAVCSRQFKPDRFYLPAVGRSGCRKIMNRIGIQIPRLRIIVPATPGKPFIAISRASGKRSRHIAVAKRVGNLIRLKSGSQ